MDDLRTALAEIAPEVDTASALEAFRSRRRRDRRRRHAGVVIAVVAALGLAALVASALGDGGKATVIAGGGNSTRGPSTLLPDRDFTVLEMGEAGDHDPIGKLRSAVTQAELDELWNAVGFTSGVPAIDGSIVVSITIADDACPPTLTKFDRTGDVLTPVFTEPEGGCIEPLIPKSYVVALRDGEWLRPSFALRLPAREHFNDERRLLVMVPSVEGSAPSTLLAGRDFTELATVVGSLDPIGTLRAASSQAEVDSLRRAIGLATEVRLRDDEVVVSITIADNDCPKTLTSFERSGDVLTPVFEQGRTGCGNPLSPVAFVVALHRAESFRPSFTLRLPAEMALNEERRLLVTVPPSTTSTPTTS